MEFTEQELPTKLDSVAVKLTEIILPIIAVPLFLELFIIKINKFVSKLFIEK